MNEEEVSYIAKRYHKGRFSVDVGWRRLNIAPSILLRRLRIAAAVASVIVITATAAVIYHQVSTPQSQIEVQQPIATSPKEVVKVIDFENTPLPTVTAKIREVYGVEVINLPDNAAEYRLSLHFEGNPVDLVATINEILATNMSIKE